MSVGPPHAAAALPLFSCRFFFFSSLFAHPNAVALFYHRQGLCMRAAAHGASDYSCALMGFARGLLQLYLPDK